MNRVDFMKQLESLLQNISPEEREEALQYYEDYFNDAGVENEANVIEALGNPAKVAENIKRDLYGAGYGGAANANASYGNSSYQKNSASDRALVEYQGTASGENKKEHLSTGMIVLIVILCVLASPVIVGLCGILIGCLASLLVAWFAVIFAFGVAAISLFCVALILLFVGVGCIFTSPLTGVALIGGCLLCCGIGILFLMLTVAMTGIVTPAICSGIVELFRMIFRKKNRKAGEA